MPQTFLRHRQHHAKSCKTFNSHKKTNNALQGYASRLTTKEKKPLFFKNQGPCVFGFDTDVGRVDVEFAAEASARWMDSRSFLGKCCSASASINREVLAVG